MHAEAERIFVAVGRRLKVRRFDDDADAMYSYVGEDGVDPARNDRELQLKLHEQGKVAKAKLDRVFEEFVEKQASGVRPEESSDDRDTEDEGEEGYAAEEVEEYEKNLAAYDEMVGRDSQDDDDEVDKEEEMEEDSDENEGTEEKEAGVRYMKDVDSDEEEEEDYEIEEIDLADDSEEPDEPGDDGDIEEVVIEGSPMEEEPDRERKSSGSLNSLLDSDHDD